VVSGGVVSVRREGFLRRDSGLLGVEGGAMLSLGADEGACVRLGVLVANCARFNEYVASCFI
jgi:hypothetical protein